jgi:hypothetical protein
MAEKSREAGSEGLVFDEPTLSNVWKSEPLVEVLTRTESSRNATCYEY